MMQVLRAFVVSIFISLFVALPAAAMPSSPLTQPLTQFAVCGGTSNYVGLGLEPWYSCVIDANGNISITHVNQIWLIALTVLEDLLKIAGYLAVGFVIWGGIKYAKSNGNPGETTQARDVIKNALIGLIITLLSVAIVNFVAGSFRP